MLKGKSIELRPPISSDVKTILRWENDMENWLVSNTLKPYTIKEIEEFVEAGQDFFRDGQIRLMIVTQANKLAGCIDVFDFDEKNRRAGVGVLIDKNFRGMGLGHEAMRLTVTFCFNDLEVHGLYAEVFENNEASKQLFVKSGFSLVGVKKDWLWDGLRYHNQMLFQKISSS